MIERVKNILLISLSVIVFALFYFIIIGRFCSCSTIYCPSDDLEIRSYLT